MRTSTYIFKNEEDEFVVVCKIECPSQSWNWIKSQQDEVRENVYNRIREAIESAEVAGENESLEVPFSEDLEKMKEHEPISIIENEHYKPQFTPVTHVANLANTSMIDFYHGCGKGIAYVKDNKVLAFQYGYCRFSNEPEGCERVKIDFSCTQICFEL